MTHDTDIHDSISRSVASQLSFTITFIMRPSPYNRRPHTRYTLSVHPSVCLSCAHRKLDTKLSQRDRTMLHAIKYFTISFKVTQGHSKWHPFVYNPYYYWNCACISYCFWVIQCQKWRDLEIGVRSRSRSLIMALFDRSYTTYYLSAVVSIALPCTIFKLFDIK